MIKLCTSAQVAEGETFLQVMPGQKFPFHHYFSDFITASAEKNLTICSSDPQWLFRYIASFFEPVEAAGGLVKNNKGQILLIFRKGKWDLPKGHGYGNESMEETALREVEEECGIDQLVITESLPTTFHVYDWKKGLWAMKKTWWYLMETKTQKTPKPQTSEHIELARWLEKERLPEIFGNIYGSVREVIEFALTKKMI